MPYDSFYAHNIWTRTIPIIPRQSKIIKSQMNNILEIDGRTEWEWRTKWPFCRPALRLPERSVEYSTQNILRPVRHRTRPASYLPVLYRWGFGRATRLLVAASRGRPAASQSESRRRWRHRCCTRCYCSCPTSSQSTTWPGWRRNLSPEA